MLSSSLGSGAGTLRLSASASHGGFCVLLELSQGGTALSTGPAAAGELANKPRPARHIVKNNLRITVLLRIVACANRGVQAD